MVQQERKDDIIQLQNSEVYLLKKSPELVKSYGDTVWLQLSIHTMIEVQIFSEYVGLILNCRMTIFQVIRFYH